MSISLLNSRAKDERRVKDIHEKDAAFISKSYEAAMYASEKLGWTRIVCTKDGKMLPAETITGMITEAAAGII